MAISGLRMAGWETCHFTKATANAFNAENAESAEDGELQVNDNTNP